MRRRIFLGRMRGIKESKRFFFEKKKQKTFYPLCIASHWRVGCAKQHLLASPVSPGNKVGKFFCFFFFKKRSASLRHCLRPKGRRHGEIHR